MLILVSICLGTLLGIDEYNLHLLCSTQWLFVGVVSYLVFTFMVSLTAAFGGLVSLLHITSIWPQVYYRVTNHPRPSHRALFVAVATHSTLVCTSRIIVAGVVPLVDIVVVMAMATQWVGLRKWYSVGLSMGWIRSTYEPNGSKERRRRPSYTMMFGRMVRRLSTVVEVELEEEEEVTENGIHEKRLQELLSSQEEEIKKFDIKKLKRGK